MKTKKQLIPELYLQIEKLQTELNTPKKLSIKSAGLNNGVFEVILSDNSTLIGIDKISVKPVGYGDEIDIDISARVGFGNKQLTK